MLDVIWFLLGILSFFFFTELAVSKGRESKLEKKAYMPPPLPDTTNIVDGYLKAVSKRCKQENEWDVD